MSGQKNKTKQNKKQQQQKNKQTNKQNLSLEVSTVQRFLVFRDSVDAYLFQVKNKNKTKKRFYGKVNSNCTC